MTDPFSPASVTFPALGTTATLLVADSVAMHESRSTLEAELAAVESACSRFRPDSELSLVNAASGTSIRVSVLFGKFLSAALYAAVATGGAVDPTVGRRCRRWDTTVRSRPWPRTPREAHGRCRRVPTGARWSGTPGGGESERLPASRWTSVPRRRHSPPTAPHR